jgi:cellobiose-specific phosphotransferase system component IIA
MEITLLLTHAQDSLMSAVSEMYIPKNMIKVVERLYNEIQNTKS